MCLLALCTDNTTTTTKKNCEDIRVTHFNIRKFEIFNNLHTKHCFCKSNFSIRDQLPTFKSIQ